MSYTPNVDKRYLFALNAMPNSRGGSRTAATSKMERFVVIVMIKKGSILDVAAVVDPPLNCSTH